MQVSSSTRAPTSIFKLDPISGAVLGQFTAPTAQELTGLAFLNGSLWGTDINFNIYQIDPVTGKLLGQFSPGADFSMTGLAGDPSRGVLWAVSQSHTLYEIDPVKQTIIKSAPDGLGLFEQDLGFFNNELYVSETFGPGANDIAVFNANTLTETRDLPMNVATFISGLAADGFALGGIGHGRERFATKKLGAFAAEIVQEIKLEAASLTKKVLAGPYGDTDKFR